MDTKQLGMICLFGLAVTTMNLVYQPKSSEFEQFKQHFGKEYADFEEESYREAVFISNLEKVQDHNDDRTRSYKMEINHLSDLTQEEFAYIYLQPMETPNQENRDDYSPVFKDYVDWRLLGAVQPIKDQGKCLSCWAFSATSAVESYKWVETGSLGSFAEQQLISCDNTNWILGDSNNGCNGGQAFRGMNYFAQNGMCTQQTYPYSSGFDGSNKECFEHLCTKDSFTISGYELVKGVSALKNACRKQPISVVVDAKNWHQYSSGIFDDCGKSLDHAVNLVGYTQHYWIVRNSWTNQWGEDGYIKLSAANNCGIADFASYPV